MTRTTITLDDIIERHFKGLRSQHAIDAYIQWIQTLEHLEMRNYDDGNFKDITNLYVRPYLTRKVKWVKVD